MNLTEPCPRCDGTGVVGLSTLWCSQCKGKTVVPSAEGQELLDFLEKFGNFASAEDISDINERLRYAGGGGYE